MMFRLWQNALLDKVLRPAPQHWGGMKGRWGTYAEAQFLGLMRVHKRCNGNKHVCLDGAGTLLWVQISLFAWNSVCLQACLAHAVGVSLTLLRCGSLREEVFQLCNTNYSSEESSSNCNTDSSVHRQCS